MEFWKSLTKEYSLFYPRSQNKKKMIKLDFSRKFKMK